MNKVIVPSLCNTSYISIQCIIYQDPIHHTLLMIEQPAWFKSVNQVEENNPTLQTQDNEDNTPINKPKHRKMTLAEKKKAL